MKGESILIVEDDEDFLYSCRRVLSKDYAVRIAKSCEEALVLWRRGPYDLTLIDMKMPGADPVQLIRWIRENHPDYPVVAMTGYSSLDTLSDAVKSGATGYLYKPFEMEALTATVSNCLAKGNKANRAAIAGRKVMVVDDEPEMLAFFRTILEAKEAQVIVASNGQEGLEKIRAASPDIVILDVMLPGPNGFDVCRKIRSETAMTQPLIILFSAALLPDYQAKVSQVGADAFLAKPFDPFMIIEIAENLLKGHKPGA